jgi:pyruvate ferredoxin oxidoreductase beta subunit
MTVIDEKVYRKIKDLNPDELIAPGSPLCAGCGGLEGFRLAAKVLGDNLVCANAAGCFTLLSIFPFSPLHGSWLYTSMSAPTAAAQGIRDALDIRMEKYGLPATEDVQVMVIAGDGSTYDMGLAPTSAAIHRGLDFIYFCYDNQGYGNTGFQWSASSPYGSRTQTSPNTGEHPAGTERPPKDIFEIWRAHNPAYLATVSPREPMDLSNKFAKAKNIKGPRLFVCLAPCPTGWGFDPKDSHAIARLAVDTGLFPLKEWIAGGDVVHTKIPRKRAPVEAFLITQKRFRHLFEPERRDGIIRRIQENVDRYWSRYE